MMDIPPLFWLVCLGALLFVLVSILAAAVQAWMTAQEERARDHQHWREAARDDWHAHIEGEPRVVTHEWQRTHGPRGDTLRRMTRQVHADEFVRGLEDGDEHLR